MRPPPEELWAAPRPLATYLDVLRLWGPMSAMLGFRRSSAVPKYSTLVVGKSDPLVIVLVTAWSTDTVDSTMVSSLAMQNSTGIYFSLTTLLGHYDFTEHAQPFQLKSWL